MSQAKSSAKGMFLQDQEVSSRHDECGCFPLKHNKCCAGKLKTRPSRSYARSQQLVSCVVSMHCMTAVAVGDGQSAIAGLPIGPS